MKTLHVIILELVDYQNITLQTCRHSRAQQQAHFCQAKHMFEVYLIHPRN